MSWFWFVYFTLLYILTCILLQVIVLSQLSHVEWAWPLSLILFTVKESPILLRFYENLSVSIQLSRSVGISKTLELLICFPTQGLLSFLSKFRKDAHVVIIRCESIDFFIWLKWNCPFISWCPFGLHCSEPHGKFSCVFLSFLNFTENVFVQIHFWRNLDWIWSRTWILLLLFPQCFSLCETEAYRRRNNILRRPVEKIMFYMVWFISFFVPHKYNYKRQRYSNCQYVPDGDIQTISCIKEN